MSIHVLSSVHVLPLLLFHVNCSLGICRPSLYLLTLSLSVFTWALLGWCDFLLCYLLSWEQLLFQDTFTSRLEFSTNLWVRFSSKWYLFWNSDLLIFCIWMFFLHVCMFIVCVCFVSVEAIKESVRFSWDWIYRCLWNFMRALETELGPLEKQ